MDFSGRSMDRRRKDCGCGFPWLLDNLNFSSNVFDFPTDGNKAGEAWAIALSEDGQYLASTAFDGRINVWDNVAGRAKIREFETKGSFGMAVDLVSSGSRCKVILSNTQHSPWTEDLRHLATRTEVSIYSITIQGVYCTPYQVNSRGVEQRSSLTEL